jgi:hypothetical protein
MQVGAQAGKSILIPKSVEEIGKDCFYACKSFYEITFESGCQLKEMGKFAFDNSCLNSIRMPKSVEKIVGNCSYQRHPPEITVRSNLIVTVVERNRGGPSFVPV